MNKEQEQGFFNQIEDVLHTHEETYELGAWEEFDANRKKKKRNFPVYIWMAAAVVLLIAGFGIYEISKENEFQNGQSLVKNRKDQEVKKELKSQPEEAVVPSRLTIEKAEQTVESSQLQVKDPRLTSENTLSVTAAQQGQIIDDSKSVQQPESTKATHIEKAIAQNGTRPAPVFAGAYDSLINRNSLPVAVEKSKSKLTYSLVVSPSISNQKMNFGAGMELSYDLGNRISVNSGLLYTSLNAKSDGKSLMSNRSTKSQSANLAIAGIELPLGIQYQTSGGFYATAGVSAVGLIKDKLEYNVLEEKTITQSSVVAGQSYEVLKVVSERKTEKSIDPANNYMGFFNFSAGKKQSIGSLNLNIGPFVKVPFSSVSSEKIKLLQGGIKISVDF